MPYINHTYGTSGSIWEGRFKASLIHDEEYLFTCMRYIELNPVRANMVNNPSQYRWSSNRCNAQGIESKLVQPHSLYIQLGRAVKSRYEAYKTLFRAHVDPEELKDIRAALQTGTPLGNDYFRDKIEKKLKTKVGQNRRGRPLKTALTS